MTEQTKQVSLHGLRVYTTPEDKLVGKGGFVAGGTGAVGNKAGDIVLPGSPSTVAVFDDFLGDTLQTPWNPVSHDTGNTVATVVAGAGGIARTTISAESDQGVPTMSAGITGGLAQWKANQGSLRFGARVKMSSLTGLNLFVGFSDSGGSETPIYDTGALTANATSAAGFLWSPAVSNHWRGVATGSAVSAVGDTGDTPVANVYDVLEMDFGSDSGQTVRFYRNGAYFGKIDNPVNAATGLTPSIIGWGADTGTGGSAFTFDVDWINVSANRDTGL